MNQKVKMNRGKNLIVFLIFKTIQSILGMYSFSTLTVSKLA